MDVTFDDAFRWGEHLDVLAIFPPDLDHILDGPQHEIGRATGLQTLAAELPTSSATTGFGCLVAQPNRAHAA
jgi:hypothetical protein